MNQLFKKIIIGALIIISPLVSNLSFARSNTEAFFCESCTNYQIARQQATYHAAPMQCTGGKPGKFSPDDPMVCSREDRRVILVNQNTNEKWAFFVKPSLDQQSIIVTDTTVSANEEEGYQAVIDSYNIWLSALSSVQSIYDTSSNIPSFKSANSCPSNTALDTLRDANMLNSKLSSARSRLESELNGAFFGNGNCSEILSNSVSASVGGIGYSIQTSSNLQVMRSVTEMFPSEVNSDDRLVYTANSVSCDTNDNWRVSMQVSLNQSTVLGQLGVTGAADAINRAVNDPNFTAGDGTLTECLSDDVESLGLVTGNSTTGRIERVFDGESLDLDLGWRSQCFIDFYQDGELLYSWEEPCE